MSDSPSIAQSSSSTQSHELPNTNGEEVKQEDNDVPLKDPTSIGQGNVGVILQSLCHLHRWTRSNTDIHIFERADRLRSIRLGIAIAHGRLSAANPDLANSKGKGKAVDTTTEDATLENLLESLSLGNGGRSSSSFSNPICEGYPFSISSTLRRLPLDSPAVAFAHGPEYASQLLSYISKVPNAHAAQVSEVPENLSQGDLYLSERSLEALEGALGACCQAVDEVCDRRREAGEGGGAKRFVSIRPPGHHCEAETPMGFCWLNNAAVAAAHAHLEHGIDRVIILDIDLHHGNGTQQIAWRLNALAHKQLQAQVKKSASPKKASPKKGGASVHVQPEEQKPPLQLYYGSLHDVNSYPCEDLDPTLIAAASVNISGGGGGQYITNVHLSPYTTSSEFHDTLYPLYRDQLLQSASSFLTKTSADPAKTLMFISAGFDASEHEYASMSRHGARVPTGFFGRFASDASQFAERYSEGKMVAVLEGGYSLRALSTGVGSLLTGLVKPAPYDPSSEDWWDPKLLQKHEKLLPPTHTSAWPPAASKSKPAFTASKKEDLDAEEDWYRYAKEAFQKMEEAMPDKDLSPLPSVVKPKAQNHNLVGGDAGVGRQTRSRANTPAPSPVKKEKKSAATASSLNAVAPAVPNANGHADSVTATAVDEASGSDVPLKKEKEEDVQSSVAQEKLHSEAQAPAKPTPLIRFTFKAGQAER